MISVSDRGGAPGAMASSNGAAYTQKGRPLELLAPLPSTLLLRRLEGREGISQLFEFQLELSAENGKEVAFDKVLGQPAAVRLALDGGRDRYFHGIINQFSQGGRDASFTHYRAQIVPKLWLLTRRVQSRIFQHISVPNILKEVLAGLQVSFQIQGVFHERDYCVQYRESDFHFASRLMEEEGIFYFFRHKADAHELVVANSPQGHPELPEQSKVIYDSTTGGVGGDLRVSEWEKVQELRAGKHTARDHSFEMPDKHLEATKATLQSVQVGKVSHALQVGGNEALEVYDYPGRYAGRFDGIDRGGSERRAELEKIFEDSQRTVRLRMEEETAAGLVIQGAGSCRQFVSGHRFTLERHFNADGAYVLTRVAHSAGASGGLRSGEQGTLEYRNQFTCIPLTMPFRPARTTPRPRVEGTQTAVVVGPKDEEIFVDKYGRVKVKFRWDRDPKKDADSSCWVRVAQSWAGKRYGAFAWPRVGHEVIVAFLEGDPDQPIVVGSVYNADHMPPHELPKTKMVSGLRTNSTPGGGGYNGILFDDTKGKEKVTIHGQHDMDTTVEHDQTTTVRNDRKDEIKINDSETVGQNQTIEVGADQKLTVKAKQTIDVTADQTTTVGGKQTIDVTGDIEITSASSITLGVDKSQIKLTPEGIDIVSSGPIKINGATVEVNC